VHVRARHGSSVSLLLGRCSGGKNSGDVVGSAAASGSKPPQAAQQGPSRNH
jgi:hypothetical protein